MKSNTPWMQYEVRLKRVAAYIHDHLDDDLDMDKLAEIACLSPWHWHRVYRAVHGETAIATVKRLRLHRAAGELVYSDKPVNQIAKRAGYPNVQSFTRTFGDFYGKSPAKYRKTGNHAVYRQATRQGDSAMFNVEIKNLEPMRIVGLPHTGPYMEISRSYTQLWQLLNTRQLYRQGMVGIGVYYDNPDITPPDQLNSFAAVSAPDDVQADAPLTEKILAGGTHAVLTFTGPYSDLHSAYHWLFGTWLPQSQRMIGSEPSYEIYRNDPMTTPPAELVTEICLPLQPE